MLTSPKLIAPLQIALGIALNGTRRRVSQAATGRNLRLEAASGPLADLRLACHLTGLDVGPEPLEGGRAQGAGLRPFAELEVGHQARLDEDRVLGRLAAVEWAARALQPGELAGKKAKRLLREACAHLAGVHEASILVVADRQRAHATPAPALARAVAADDHVLGADVLDLQPGAAAPPALVVAVEALGDDALDAELPG